MLQRVEDANLNNGQQRVKQLQQQVAELQEQIQQLVADEAEKHKIGEQASLILAGLRGLEPELLHPSQEGADICSYPVPVTSLGSLDSADVTRPEVKQRLIAPDPEFITRMTRTGKYLHFQPARNFVPGPKIEVAKGVTLHEEFPLELANQYLEYIDRALTTGEAQVFEFQRQKNHLLVDEEAYIVPIQPDEVLIVVRDISYRKRVECEILRREATNRALVEAIPDLVIRMARSGLYLDYRQPSGFSAESQAQDALGKNIGEILPMSIAQEQLGLVQKALQTGDVQVHEFQLSQNGKSVYHEARISPINADEVLVIVRNISDRKDVEAALRQSEANLFALVENTADLIWSVDTHYRLLTLNSAFFHCFQATYNHQLTPGCDILSYLPGTAKQYWQALYDRALAGEHFSVEYQSPSSPQGRCLEVSFNPIRHEQTQQIVGVSVFSTDITTYKEAQNVLETAKTELELKVQERTIELSQTIAQLSQEIQERQRVETELELRDRAISASNNGIVICDARLPDIPLIYVNHAFEEITGYSRAEVIGKNCRFLQGHNTLQPALHVLRSALKEGRPCAVTLQNYRKDGSPFWNDLSIAPIYDADNLLTHYVGIQTDITELKQSEAEIHKALVKERELGELKSRFISMTSHEFRTPLTVILSSASLLENYGHRWSDDKKLIHLQRIQIAGRRMTQLLDDILVLSKAEADKLQYQPACMDLVQFCQDLVSDLRLSDNEQHQICFSYPTPIPTVCMDEKMLQQILNNLLSNALKYSEKNSVIAIQLSYEQSSVVFQIQDEGIGIPASDLPHIFESFHRGHNVGTISGTGLGLTIVKKCVDLQGGTISVTSREDMGTLFVVKLPALQSGPNHDEDFSN